MSYYLGIDVGGTKTEVALFSITEGKVDDEHYFEKNQMQYSARFLARERMETLRRGGYDSAITRIIALCKKIMNDKNIDVNSLSGVGIGLPGPVDPEKLQMIAGNSAIFIDQPISLNLKEALNYNGEIKVANDANCFTLAETLAGAGYKHKLSKKNFRSLGIILGTGVGGGFCYDEELYVGRRGGASEWGHIPFVSEGHPCYCGNLGCVEQYLSGPALEASFAMRMYSQILHRPKAAEIFELAELKDPMAMAVVKRYKRYLGKFVSTLSQIYDPDIIILGGGVSLQKELYREIHQAMMPYLFIKNSPPEVVPHMLGDSSGVLGAALLAFP